MKPKMTAFTYKNMKVRVTKDITDRPPFDNKILIPAGTEVRIQKTLRQFHYVKVEGELFPIQIKISDTKIVYP